MVATEYFTVIAQGHAKFNLYTELLLLNKIKINHLGFKGF